MSMKIISRGKGHSVVAASAYRAADIVKNEHDGVLHDYSRKDGVVYSDILIPDRAPVEFNYRHHLWNAVEEVEKNSNAQLAREVRLALPAEFDIRTNVHLVNEYVNQYFVSRGMCADISIHDSGDGNPHAHVLLTVRPIDDDGKFSAKSRMEYILDDNGEKIKLPSGRYKTKKVTITDWDNRDNAEVWREGWADVVNKYLEKDGYDFRVDHRSYERQGLDIIPTIHLGSVAHGLEKQGIRTERGDTNRRIKADNERLGYINAHIRSIKREIHEIKNPPTPQFIIDVQNAIKAQNSVGYANWAALFNLQQMAKTLIYIQQNGYTDLPALQAAHTNAVHDYNAIIGQRNEVRNKIKDLKALRNAVNSYRKTSDTYKKYTDPRANSYFKNQYYENHKGDIETHKRARSYIYDELKLTKFPSLKELSKQINQLAEMENNMTASLHGAREKYKTLNVINHNTRMLLGYNEVEENNINPVTAIQRHCNYGNYKIIPVHKATFASATTAEAKALYFQNRFIDRECADTIKYFVDDIVQRAATQEQAVDELIAMYGLERVEWVLAATVANSTSEHLEIYSEWASQKELPNEPCDISALGDTEASRAALAKLIRAVQLKSAEVLWDKRQSDKLSYEDRTVVAKIKSDRSKQQAVQPVPQPQTVLRTPPQTPPTHKSASQI